MCFVVKPCSLCTPRVKEAVVGRRGNPTAIPAHLPNRQWQHQVVMCHKPKGAPIRFTRHRLHRQTKAFISWFSPLPRLQGGRFWHPSTGFGSAGD